MLLPMLFLLLFAGAAAAPADKDPDPGPVPMMRTVEPASVKAGALVLVSGENLGRRFVAEVYLSDGTRSQKVAVTEQTDASLKFTVPADCKPGRYLLVVLVNSHEPVLLEEPVKLTVVE